MGKPEYASWVRVTMGGAKSCYAIGGTLYSTGEPRYKAVFVDKKKI